jgi:hypothetical protein
MGVGRDGERLDEARSAGGSDACPSALVLSGVRPVPAMMGRGPKYLS